VISHYHKKPPKKTSVAKGKLAKRKVEKTKNRKRKTEKPDCRHEDKGRKEG
jgi:hypothetical protein